MGRDDPSRRTSTSTVALPGWLESGAQNAISAAQDFYSQGFTPYTGQRVAPLSPDTLNAQQQIRGMQPSALYGEAADLYRGASGRVVDEGGPLGAVSDYVNPYTQAMLDPALRQMEQTYRQEQNRVGAIRTSSGGYGDARHGVLEAENFKNYLTGRGDVTARAYGTAFDQAMGLRQNDLARMFTGAGGLLQTAGGEFGQQQQLLQNLMNSGLMTQQQQQNQLNTQYEGYLNEQQDAYNRLAALVGATGGVPYGTTQTDVAARGYPFLQFLGNLAGSAVGGWASGWGG